METLISRDLILLGPTSNVEDNEPLDRFLYYRFGFAWSPGEPIPSLPVFMDLTEIRKIFGDTSSPLTSRSIIPLQQFIEALLQKQRPPDELWDLTSIPPNYFKAYVPFKGHIQYRNSLVVVEHKAVKYYFLFPVENRSPRWYVVTQQAAAALESLRRGHTTRLEAANYFLERGIPFSTRAVATANTTNTSDGSSSSLSLLSLSLPPPRNSNLNNYKEYERRLKRFLQQPHARAAFLQGGIIWRLVQVSNSQIEFPLQTILAGPVPPFEPEGRHVFPNGGKEYWDNTLTDADIDLICGVYQVHTGRQPTSRVSWWPRPKAWDKSGLNVGYWSPACESWFQRRLQQISEGKAEPRTASRWRTSLVLLRKQIRIAQTNEGLAAEWIEKNLARKLQYL